MPLPGEGTQEHDRARQPAEPTPLPDDAWQETPLELRLNELVGALQLTHPRDWGGLVAQAVLEIVPDAGFALVLSTEPLVPPRVLAAAGEGVGAWPGVDLEMPRAVLDRVRAGGRLLAPRLRLSAAGGSLVAGSLVLPLPCPRARERALVVGRLEGRSFSLEEMATLGQLIRRVQLSVEWHRRSEALVRSERLRIATQAQEHAVAPLFSASMELANLAGAATNPLLRRRLVGTVSTLDEVIAWLRGRLSAVTAHSP